EIGLRLRRSNNQLSRRHVSIHFRPAPDVPGQIDSGLDGKSNPRNKQSLIAGLEIVDVRPRAMKLVHIYGVSGSVRDIVAKSLGLNDRARGVIDLRSPHGLIAFDSFFEQCNRSLARSAHSSPEFRVAIGGLSE